MDAYECIDVGDCAAIVKESEVDVCGGDIVSDGLVLGEAGCVVLENRRCWEAS